MTATPLNACAISDYYMRCFIYEPPFFQNREFAFVLQKTQHNNNPQMIRHFTFPNIEKLRAFLIEYHPAHCYYSSAKYQYPGIPDMPTKKKGWISSDLVFDIDKDKLKVPTLQEAKRQSLKLIRILRKNFGLEDLLWVFSGSRGYHVHCRDECIQKLGNPERREIADYFQEFLPGRKNRKGEPVPNRKYVQIDAPVTCDFTRLIRLPGTIHGMSGHVCELLPLPKSQLPPIRNPRHGLAR